MSPAARKIPPATTGKSPFALGLERLLLCAVFVAVVAFYGWTVKTTAVVLPKPHGDEGDYYNLLSHGFLDGHTYLKREVPPELIHAENPYDPSKRPPGAGMHDASYYNGRYYLYFGVTPVATLITPFRLLTGNDLPQPYANWFFVSIGFLASSQAWLGLRRRYFPGSRTWVAVLGVLALGCCGMTLSLVRRPSIWELPISAGYAFAMLAVALLLQGLHTRRRNGWFLLAGCALGLAVGARPSYVAAAVILPLAVLGLWWKGVRCSRWGWLPPRSWWGESLVLGGSFAAVVAGLLVYNYARFHNPLEFGLNYQLTGTVESKVKHFSLSFMPFNGYIYFLSPAQWSRYFPFVQLIRPPSPPAGYYGIEYPYGVLVNMPLTLLALAWPLGLLRRTPAGRIQLALAGWGITVLFVVMAVFLCGFVTGAQRYMADFTPSLVLLGCLGLLGVEWALAGAPRWLGRTMRPMLAVVAAFSVFFGVMVSFQLHGLLKTMSPASYTPLARAFNLPVYLWEKATGFHCGPVEITLKLPHGRAGKIEPLVSTGWEFYSDHVFILYLDDKTVRIGFDHLSHGTKISSPIELDFDVEHKVRVELGSLYPPAEHPYFAGMTELEQSSLLRWLRVTVDDKPVIETSQVFYEGSPESLSVGRASATRAYGERFTGQILSVKRGEFRPLSEPRGIYGPITLLLYFPRGVAGRSQPLVTTGVTGKADVLYVRYVTDDVVRFGYDHWGVGAWESGDVPVEHDLQHRLEIRLPALMREPEDSYTALRRVLLITLDERVVWSAQVPVHASTPNDVYIGRNSAGSSVCEPEYSGMITSVARERETLEPAERDPNHARIKLLFPRGRPGTRDPVFVRGAAGAADVIYAEYTDAEHLVLGWDHWGVGAQTTAPIAIDYGRIHEVEVKFNPAGGPTVELDLDGVEVLTTKAAVYPATADTVTVGLNRIGASTCGETFNGAVVGVEFPTLRK